MITTGDWDRIRTLFQTVLEQPPESREAFLEAACNGDEDLRVEVQSLLESHLASDGFLETPPRRFDAALETQGRLTLEAGERLGRSVVTWRSRSCRRPCRAIRSGSSASSANRGCSRP
jgi:hypothetical protein